MSLSWSRKCFRLQSIHPAAPRHRRLRIEFLERRYLLSGVSTDYNDVSAAWFGATDDPATFEESQESSQSSSRWVVRFDASLTAALGGIKHAWQGFLAPTVLSPQMIAPWREFSIVSGLGLPGQILVEAYAPTDQAAIDLARVPHLASFEPEQIVGGSSATYPNEQTESAELYSQLYGLDQIEAPDAWSITTGSHSTVVAEIDSGIDLTHPDLYQNIWLNNGEIPPDLFTQLFAIHGDGPITLADLNAKQNGTYVYAAYVTDFNQNGYIDAEDILADPRWTADDPTHLCEEPSPADYDCNGFPHDLFGWNFVANTNYPADDNIGSHGTHVAGTIAAVGNNGVGVTGVAWTASLLPLKFLNQNNQGSDANAIAAFNYMKLMKDRYTEASSTRKPGDAIQGANIQVSNNSWGINGALNAGLENAVKNAGDVGILTIAAAGNGNALGQGIDNDSQPFYPASFDDDRILSVAASDSSDQLWRKSNFGRTSVDIAAPGISILSTIRTNSGQDPYGFDSGTSMAAPFVSGVAALIYSQHPGATPQEVREAILHGADRKQADGIADLPLAGQISPLGGRLNAYGALRSEVFAPRATLVAPLSDITQSGLSSALITVHYTRTSTGINTGDISIVREGFSSQTFGAQLQSTTLSSDGASISAVYAISSHWNAQDAGTYDIVLNPDQVFGPGHIAAPRQVLGHFQVTISDSHVVIVNSTADSVFDHFDPITGQPMDAQNRTTLRVAIMAVNSFSPGDYTILVPDGMHRITRPGRNEDGSATGDLDISNHITLVGGGRRSTTIDGQLLDRVLDIRPGGSLRLSQLTVSGGTASGVLGDRDGGGIRNQGALVVEQVDIARNSADDSGGGISNSGSIAIGCNDNTYSGASCADITTNSAAYAGGGIYSTGYTALSFVNVLSNTTTDSRGAGGGGIRNNGQLIMAASTLAFNVSSAGTNVSGGGGLSNGLDGTAWLINSTFSSNRVQSADGGGIYNNGTIYAANLTVTENTAISGNGGGLANFGSFWLFNSIVAANLAHQAPRLEYLPPTDVTYFDVSGTFNSWGVNLIGTMLGSSGFAASGQFPDRFGTNSRIDPLLKPLAANRAGTLTHSLGPESPAFDGSGLFLSPFGAGDPSILPDLSLLEPVLDPLVVPSGGVFFSYYSDAQARFRDDSVADTGAFERAGEDNRIRGSVYVDRNGNGVRDGSEPGLSDWTLNYEMVGRTTVGGTSITRADDPQTPYVDESGQYEFSNVFDGFHHVRLSPQDGFVLGTPYDIADNPSALLRKVVDETSNPPGSSEHFGTVADVQVNGSLITFLDSDADVIYRVNDDQSIQSLVKPGDIVSNNDVLAHIAGYRQDGSHVAVIASATGSTGYRLYLLSPDGTLSPIANPNPILAFPEDTESSAVCDMVGGAMLFVGQGGLFASTATGVVQVAPLGTAVIIGGSSVVFSAIRDPRVDSHSGQFTFTADALIDGLPSTGVFAGHDSSSLIEVLGTNIGVSYASEDGVESRPISGIVSQDLADGELAYATTSNGLGVIRQSHFSPGVFVGTPLKLTIDLADRKPAISFDNSSIIVGAEDSSGAYGLYLAHVNAGPSFKIIATGDTLPDDTRQIAGISMDNGNAFNGKRVGFAVQFTDGTTAACVAEISTVDGHRVLAIYLGAGDVENLDFGAIPLPAEIRGNVFQDKNLNGKRELNEAGLAGWEIVLTPTTPGAAVRHAVTDGNGSYAFLNVDPLQNYVVSETPLDGWDRTAPFSNAGTFDVTPDAGQIVTGINFGNVKSADASASGSFSIQGTVRDTAGNPKSGVVVYLDQDGSSTPSAGEKTTTTGANGQYNFPGNETGNYEVRLDLSDPQWQGFEIQPQLSNSFARQEYKLGKNPTASVAGNFDHKNGDDLAVVVSDHKQVHIFLNNGQGFLGTGPAQKLTTHNNVATNPTSIAMADVNNDGWQDLIVGSESGRNILVYLNTKDTLKPFPENPTARLSIPTTSGNPISLAVGDFHGGDGSFPDIAVGTAVYTGYQEVSGKVVIFRNNGAGGYSDNPSHIVSNVGINPHSLTIHQNKNDSTVYLAVANFGDNTVQILEGDGQGGFSKFGSPYPVGSGPNSDGSGPTAIAAAYLDDGDFFDLVTTNYTENTVTVLWGSSSGFTTTKNDTHAAGKGPSSVVLTDIDIDGLTDIVVSNGAGSPDQNHVVLLRNQGNRAFGAAEPTGAATYPTHDAFSLVAGNFKNDSSRDNRIRDLALVNPIPEAGAGNEGGHVTVLINSVNATSSRRAVLFGANVVGLDFVLQSAIDVNLPPTLSAINNPSAVNEDSLPVTVSLTGITPGLDETQPLQVTVTTNNPALIIAATPQYQSPAATGSVLLTLADNQSGQATITVTVTDGGLDNDLATTADNASVQQTFALTVNPLNDLPTLDALPVALFVSQNSATQTINLSGIRAGGNEVQPLIVTATTNNPQFIQNLAVQYAGASSTATVNFTTSSADTIGQIIVSVTDGGLDNDLATSGDNLTVKQSVVILFTTSTNHAPSFVKGSAPQNINDESGLVSLTAWATAISPGPVDSALQTVQFIVTSDNPGLFAIQPAVDSAGKLTFTPKPNQVGVAQVSVVAKDDGGTTSGGIDHSQAQTFAISINKKRVWHNALIPTDVTGQGTLAADDVITIINYINAGKPDKVPTDGRGGGPYCDVTGDGSIAADDVIAVINYINAHPRSEGEATGSNQPSTDKLSNDLLTLLAMDSADQTGRRRRFQ